MDPLVTQAKSSGISALLGAAGIGVQYTPINEFTKMAIGVVILFTLVIRAVDASAARSIAIQTSVGVARRPRFAWIVTTSG